MTAISRARIGLSVPAQLPPADIPAYARRAESAGFDELWLAEDCFFAGGIAAVSAALASTRRLVVGLGIMPAVARNAAFTAMEIAAVAELYPARLMIGLGHGMAGWMRQIGAYPRSPLTALAEHIQAIRALLAGESVSVARQHPYRAAGHCRRGKTTARCRRLGRTVRGRPTRPVDRPARHRRRPHLLRGPDRVACRPRPRSRHTRVSRRDHPGPAGHDQPSAHRRPGPMTWRSSNQESQNGAWNPVAS